MCFRLLSSAAVHQNVSKTFLGCSPHHSCCRGTKNQTLSCFVVGYGKLVLFGRGTFVYKDNRIKPSQRAKGKEKKEMCYMLLVITVQHSWQSCSACYHNK